MMLLAILLQASTASDAGSAVTSECVQSISHLVAAAENGSRVVATFTGTQKALLPLDEAISAHSDAGVESTLFPISIAHFVLTIQLRPDHPGQASATTFATQTCSLATSRGVRFNGVMSFTGGRMTDADFPTMTEK